MNKRKIQFVVNFNNNSLILTQLNYFRSQLIVKTNVTVKQNEWKQSSLWWLGLMMTFLNLSCD